MARFALLDLSNNILKEGRFEEQPGDPIGKGWRWVPIVEETDPVPEADERLSQAQSRFENDQIIKFRTVEQITVDRRDVNTERDRRLDKKYNVNIKGNTVVVQMDTGSLNNLTNLAIHGLILKANNELERTTTYRDANNMNHSLTADDMCNLFVATNLQVQSLYEAAWLIKDDEALPATKKLLKQDPRWPPIGPQ